MGSSFSPSSSSSRTMPANSVNEISPDSSSSMCLNRRNHETLDGMPLWTVEKSWCILSVSNPAKALTCKHKSAG